MSATTAQQPHKIHRDRGMSRGTLGMRHPSEHIVHARLVRDGD